mgnify:CR=1 FL=1
MKSKLISLLIILIFTIPGCFGSSSNGPDLFGTEYKEPTLAPDFTLTNQIGEEVTFSEFGGKVVVVAFIYTSCPDVCLIISSNLEYVNENLGEHSDKVEIISITIDPARDTVSRLSEWTMERGYEWNHLTHESGAVMQTVWSDWNVVIDAEHIANSLPPEGSTVRLAILNPDNSTIVTESRCESNVSSSCFSSVEEFSGFAMSGSGVHLDLANGTIGDWQSNETWSWILHSWDSDNETWTPMEDSRMDSPVAIDGHLAWVASNANISELPPGIDCGGHGWVMGSGGGAHCMCDDGFERPEGDWLSCTSVSSDVENSSEESASATDSQSGSAHDETLMQYNIGHSTVTFIIDKNQNKRLAYSGIHWDVAEFLSDVKSLASE